LVERIELRMISSLQANSFTLSTSDTYISSARSNCNSNDRREAVSSCIISKTPSYLITSIKFSWYGRRFFSGFGVRRHLAVLPLPHPRILKVFSAWKLYFLLGLWIWDSGCASGPRRDWISSHNTFFRGSKKFRLLFCWASWTGFFLQVFLWAGSRFGIPHSFTSLGAGSGCSFLILQ